MNNKLLESAEFYRLRYHNFASRIILPTLILFIVCIAFLAIAEKEIAIKTTASLEPTQVLASIQSYSASPIIVNNLEENKEIQVGDLLLQYQSNQERVQETVYSNQLSYLEDQCYNLDLLKESVNYGSDQFWEDDSFGYHQRFLNYLNQIYQSESSDTAVANLKSQILSEIGEEKTSLDKAIVELQGSLSVQGEVASNNTLISAWSGVVHLNNEVSDAMVITPGTTIAYIYPNLKMQKEVLITAYISSQDITAISIGDTLRFVTQSKTNKDMTLTSKITSIDNSATVTETGNVFKVQALQKLTNEDVDKLRYGIQGNAMMIIGKKNYLTYYLDQWFGKE